MGDVPDASRVDAGRRRASAAKRAVALTAAGGFVAALVLARQTNPGVAAGSRTSLVPPAGISSEVNQGLSLGGGSIGSSSGGGSGVQPQVQSATS